MPLVLPALLSFNVVAWLQALPLCALRRAVPPVADLAGRAGVRPARVVLGGLSWFPEPKWVLPLSCWSGTRRRISRAVVGVAWARHELAPSGLRWRRGRHHCQRARAALCLTHRRRFWIEWRTARLGRSSSALSRSSSFGPDGLYWIWTSMLEEKRVIESGRVWPLRWSRRSLDPSGQH